MIKKLFFTAVLLMPGLAYGGNPSADLSVQIVPSVPAGAQAAGFTTLAANYDFSQPTYAAQANWLGCGNSNDPTKQWYQNGDSTGSVPCDINQVFDPVAGQNVLDLRWMATYPLGNDFPGAGMAMSTESRDRTIRHDFPNAYYEITYSIKSTPDIGAPLYNAGGTYDVFYSDGTHQASGQLGFELDFWEHFHFDGGACPDVNIIDWANGRSGGTIYDPCGVISGAAGSAFIADPRQYHTIGFRLTGDGTNIGTCAYIDGTFINTCRTFPDHGSEGTLRHTLLVFPAAICGFNVNIKSCLNVPITNVYNSGGHIAITLSSSVSYVNCFIGYVNITEVNITGANGQHHLCAVGESFPNSNPHTDYVLTDTTWPGGTYTGGGTFDPLTEINMYIKSIRVWSCANWQTTMCNGTVLTGML